MAYEPDDLPAPEPDALDEELLGLPALREPDLATAFLAALDALDDRRFVTPPEDAPPLPAVPPFPVVPSVPVGLFESAALEAVAPEAAAADPASEAGPEPDVVASDQEFVAFSVGELRCVVPIRSVLEVGRIPDSAAVPNAPAWLHGLGNLRGQVLALIDLRAFFGLGRVKASTGRMVVLRAEAEEIRAGVLVDQVHQIVTLSSSRFGPAPAAVPEASAPFVWGACDDGDHTMVALDVDGVLGVESLTEETV